MDEYVPESEHLDQLYRLTAMEFINGDFTGILSIIYQRLRLKIT